MKKAPYHTNKKNELNELEKVCFQCPLSFLDPPQDCIFDQSQGYCKFQKAYAKEKGIKVC